MKKKLHPITLTLAFIVSQFLIIHGSLNKDLLVAVMGFGMQAICVLFFSAEDC